MERADDKRFEELLRRRLERNVDEAQCPDASVLAAYYERTLPADQRERWEEHFSACARCREGLAALARIEAADSAQKRASASPWWRTHGLLPAAAAAFGAAAAVAVVVFVRSNSSKLSSRTEIALQSASIQTELKKETGSTAASSSGAASTAPQIAANAPAERHEPAPLRELSASPQEAASPEEAEAGALHARRKSAARAKPQGMRDEMAAGPERNALDKRLDLAERPAMEGGGAAKAAPPPSMTAEDARREATGAPAATAPAVRAGSTGAAGAAPAAPAAPASAAAGGAAAASGGGSSNVFMSASGPSIPASNTATANIASRAKSATLGGALEGNSAIEPSPTASAPVFSRSVLGAGGRGSAIESGSTAGATAASAVAVSPPDHSVVWMIGAHGSISRFIPGSPWLREQSGVDADLTAGAAPSAKACWVVGRGGTIVRTTDGMHWQRISSPTTADLTAVSAQSASDATVVAADGQRYVTSDGGTIWRAL